MMADETIKMVLVAGESSGDQLAAALLSGVKGHYARVEASGIVGTAMEREGATAWWSSQSLAVRGYFEPIRHLPRILRMRQALIDRVLHQRPDVFVGIDAPDFNLGVERRIRAQGIPTVHYVSPSIWAWRPKRIEKIRAAVDHMLLIFPFEQAIYDAAGIPATYVGHPFAPQIPMTADTAGARQKLGLAQDDVVLAILPGSRGSEIRYNAPNFLAVAQIVTQRLGQRVRCVVPIAHPHLQAELQSIARQHAPNLTIQWVDGETADSARTVMVAASATLVASGTASLEVALYKKPSVIAYRTSWLSAAIYPHLALQKWIGLPNILSQSDLIPEILQDAATPTGLANALMGEIDRYAADATVHERLCELHRSLIADTPTRCAQAIEQVRWARKQD